MIILPELREFLLADSGVQAASTGVNIGRAPAEAAKPNLVLTLFNGSEGYTHDGPDGLEEDLVRIFCRANTPEKASELAEAVKTAIGSLQNQVVGTRLVQGCFHINHNGDYTDDFSVFRQIDDYRIHHSAAPSG